VNTGTMGAGGFLLGMQKVIDYQELSCRACSRAVDLDFDFSMAFQPIVDVESQAIFAYEALVRGLNGEPFGEVFQYVNETNLYRFDQSCRVKAVSLAAELKIPCYLSINFLPNAIYKPELCIRTTLKACEEYAFPSERLIFEITEHEKVVDLDHLREIVDYYHSVGLTTAIDDFGAGYAGMNLLVSVQPKILKIDMLLIRGIEKNFTKQSLVKSIVQFSRDLGMQVIAEGVETQAEYCYLRSLGISLFQGFLFARPMFENLPEVDFERF